MILIFHTLRCSLWIILFLIYITFSLIGVTNAQPLQRIEIPSSMNPVGSGARALGMGGAFIAVADDATAASWNPGGLVQLETPEISLVGAYFQRTEDNTFETNPEANSEQDVANSNINYLSAAYPFTAFNRNMIVSVNYQYLFDFTRQWEFPLSLNETDFIVNQNVDVVQEGSLSAIGVAYSIQLTPRISFGATMNFWQDGLYDNKWQMETNQSGSGNFLGNDFTFEANTTDDYTFSGFNTNLGILWDINSRFTLGLVLKTPFTAELTHKSTTDTNLSYPDFPSANTRFISSDETDEELDMPLSYGLGLSYRFSDVFTMCLDIYRTEWGDYILTDADGNEISPITGEPANNANIEPTHQIRTGGEYLFITDTYVIPFRGGLFYDPAPADDNPDDFYGFSFGSGFAMGRFVFDIAYQYRFGNNVGTSILQHFDFSQDVDEHTVYSSLIFHF